MNVSKLAVFALIAAVLTGCGKPDNNGVAEKKDVSGVDFGSGSDAGADMEATEDMPVADVPAEPGSLVIEPRSLTFEGVRIGEPETQTVAVRNIGGKPLLVSDVVLTELNRMGEPEFETGDTWDENFIVEPSTHQDLDIVYDPTDEATDRGSVRITSNDPDASDVTVRLSTINAYMDIEAPRTLRFGTVAAGESETENVTIFNRGVDPLTISDVRLSGASTDFSISIFGDPTLPVVLERDVDMVIEVTYSPDSGERDLIDLIIESNDPDQPEFTVSVTGNAPTPCLQVSPTSVDWKMAAVGAEQTREVTLFNCSTTRGLEISAIAVDDDAGGVFSVSDAPELPATIQPLQTATFTVRGTLDAEGAHVGLLSVESSDPEQSPYLLELRIEGS